MAPGKLADLLQKHLEVTATSSKRARRASEGQPASPPPVAAEESSNEEPPADTLPQTTGGESGEEASDLEPEGLEENTGEEPGEEASALEPEASCVTTPEDLPSQGGSERDVEKARLNERKKLKERLANDPRAKARAFANAMFKPRA